MAISTGNLSHGGIPLMAVQQQILLEQEKFPGTSGEFSWLLSGITLATG
jgi:fructose-1,6-bisphosphatase I